MPTLADPPAARVKSPGSKAPPQERHWAERLTRSGYFLGAVLLHLVVFLIVATWVIFQPPAPPAAPLTPVYVQPAPPPPPVSPSTETMPTPSAVNPPAVIITTGPSVPPFTLPPPEISTAPPSVLTKTAPPAGKTRNVLSPERIIAIRNMEEQKWHRPRENFFEAGGPAGVKAEFPVYLASYADGDWNCNVHMSGPKIDAGSLPDLVAKINEWSHGNLKGEMVPTPLAIGSRELLDKMPPFIFFTGHKDFKLTGAEIENLRQYLQNGGAILSDNALAGSGSRFDVAFKAQMKRVIPDADKDFEDLPLSSDLFTKGWFNLTRLPLGMNYHAEPIQHLDIDGKVAILYSPNDYSDLLYMRILPGDTTALREYPVGDSPLFTNGLFLSNSSLFFRNFTLEGSLAAHRLGMNIIGFLLVRFDKELQLAP